MNDLPDFSNTNTVPDSIMPSGMDPIPTDPNQRKSTFNLISDIWKNLTRSQKTVLSGILILVFALPVIILGLNGQKLINQKAAEPVTPPITQPSSPTPKPTITPSPTGIRVLPNKKPGIPIPSLGPNQL